MILSPISGTSDITLIKKYDVSDIIELYKKNTGIDVSNLKKAGDTIDLYKCNDSGYFFYYPFEMAGDSLFYEELSRQGWYYSYSRWEHEKAIEFLPGQGFLLEMGCGSGFFLNKIKESKPDLNCIGLEINSKAIETGKSKGLNIINSDIIEYAQYNKEQFDFVCSFQVMEHIQNVKEVLIAQIDLLKKGGRLLIGVPNNSSYLGYNKHISRCLNMPPHHMGLWSQEVFDYIENFFGVNLIQTIEEPFSVSDFHIYHYNHLLRIIKSELLVKIYFKIRLNYLFKKLFFNRYKKNKIGHTILALFQK